MDFVFNEEEQNFIEEVRAFISEQAQKSYADDALSALAKGPRRGKQVADTPGRRAFTKAMADRGYLGMSWPKEYGGRDRPGIYEYLLNEELAAVGAPLIGKGIGCIGKTLIRHGSDKLKEEFLPKILSAEIEFALGYTEPSGGSDLASLKLKAERDGEGWRLNGQKTYTTSAHFADWYWVAARTDPDLPKHKGISVFLIPMKQEALKVYEIKTVGDERTNDVFFDDVWIHNDYLVGEVNKGWRYICEALDYERFTLFTISPLVRKYNEAIEAITTIKKDGVSLKNDPGIRQQFAHFSAEVETAKMLQRKVLVAAGEGEKTGYVPAVEAAYFKLYVTQLGAKIDNAMLNALGPTGMLHSTDEDTIDDGRWEQSYRANVVSLVGGGSSEVQKNLIAKRGLKLPLK